MSTAPRNEKEAASKAENRQKPGRTSDEAVRRATGRGREAWFALLDRWGAAAHKHSEDRFVGSSRWSAAGRPMLARERRRSPAPSAGTGNPILNYFRAQKLISSGVVEGLNNKAEVTMRKSYGFRTYRVLELASITHLANYPSRNSPTIFSDESSALTSVTKH